MMPQPHNLNDWLPLLAAYADGELDPATLRRVEAWLAENPQAMEFLHDQEQMSRGNPDLWMATEPAEPSEKSWGRVLAGISGELAAAKSEPRREPHADTARWLFAVVGGLIAVSAAVFWMAAPAPVPTEVVKQTPPIAAEPAPQPRALVEAAPAPHDPLAGFDVLPLAAARDVLIEAITGDRTPQFVGFEPLLPESLDLAGPDDVRLEAICHNPADGPVPHMPPGTPILYASRP